MIINWRTATALEMVAKWQGRHLALRYEAAAHHWRFYVDGQRTKGQWPSLPTAKEAVDAVAQRIVAKQAMVAVARQRQLFNRDTDPRFVRRAEPHG